MFGLFAKKIAPFDYGYGMGEDTLKYTKPTYHGLIKYVEKWGLKHCDQEKIITDPFYAYLVQIYTATAIFEFSLNQMKAFRIDFDALRNGFHSYMKESAMNLKSTRDGTYPLKDFPLEIEYISQLLCNEIESNNDFQRTSQVYNENDLNGCLLGQLTKIIASFAFGQSEIKKDLTSEKYKIEMIHAFEGIERGIRWIMESADPRKIQTL